MGYLKYFYWEKQSFYYGIPEVFLLGKTKLLLWDT
jgi:hypothetical protein